MDKKSANGVQAKSGEAGVQRKQLPYSVETPYGFHLDLDFLKYVDDIEKGNTIKRVHIQRRIKGPPKFSTLPRNFSLPGHGVRPVPKESTAWSGTSTLGPKPKSRVTEVQQIFDFRAGEATGSTSQSSRGTSNQGTGYVSPKPREEASVGARVEDKVTVDSQNRPNLLRASSMPITIQQRKGSDSSSPVLVTPENGSSENMFRASPDITERRCVPQDRTGLHQQITVALKRVRELEEQVKTIPELKAQICSLREEREKLLLQLQAQMQAQVSTESKDVGTQQQGHRPTQELKLSLKTQSPETRPKKPVTGQEKGGRVVPKEGGAVQISGQEQMCRLSEREIKTQEAQSQQSEKQKDTLVRPSEHAAQKLSEEITGHNVISLKEGETDTKISSCQDVREKGKVEDVDSVERLQEKLRVLEDKLTQATEQLERTNSLLHEQIEENKVKEEKILQLSEVCSRVCSPEISERSRRESIDTGTETERVDFSNQETETESHVKVDQGTDTDKICIEVFVPQPQTSESIDTKVEANLVDTLLDQVTEMAVAEAAAAAAATPPRPRTNSMERSTETERVITQDQMTETPSADRVNQVTEAQTETVTDHPMRPRTSSVDRGTETERVGTVDRVTETEAAQRTDQQTETEMNRRPDNNPERHVEIDTTAEGERASGERVEEVQDAVVSQAVEAADLSQEIQVEIKVCESVGNENVLTESLAVVAEIKIEQPTVLELASKVEEVTRTMPENDDIENKEIVEKVETKEEKTVEMEAEIKQTVEQADQKIEVKKVVEETKQVLADKPEIKKEEKDEVPAKVKEPMVTEAVEDAPPKTAAPVRPQRGRRPTSEQPQPTATQQQTAPVRPRRPSSETQASQQPPPQKNTPPQEQGAAPAPTQKAITSQEQEAPQPSAQKTTLSQKDEVTATPEPLAPTPAKVPEQQKVTPVPQVKEKVEKKKEEKPPSSQEQTTTSKPQSQKTASEVSTRPKSIQSQTSTTRRNSKEVKAPQKGGSQPSSRPTRQGSQDVPSQGSRRSSAETQPHKEETPSLRRGSSEAAQRRGSEEGKALRRDSGEMSRKGSSESPTSPAALGQVVTRLTGLLGEQWAQLGSGSGAQQQQTATQQETTTPQKQPAAKKAEPSKAPAAKATGKAAPATSTGGKPAGKAGPSKMSSIQSQLVSSLSVLSAFYSPGQKAAAAKQQQEQAGLKSIMKKNGVADKQGSKGAKKNLKFVGVNGGYETTSSEESSGDEKSKVEVEEEDSSEPEVEKEKESEPKPEKTEETMPETQEVKDTEVQVPAEPQGATGAEVVEKESERGLLDTTPEHEVVLEEDGEKVDRGFVDACLYVKDRMEEVSSPDKEMRQVLVVLYQEWFRVSSQKESKVDTVRLYLRQVGLTTPTLLPYVVNLTDGNGNMALHYSVSHSNFAVVKLLLDTGLCETDNVNKAGYTPVMLAALTAADSPDDLEVAEQLLRLGDINTRSRQAGQTALMLAVSHGRVAMVKLLLSCGADVNAQDREGSTALMCAGEHGHVHITRLLLETGRCDMSLTDKNGQTALTVAKGAVHQDIADLLKSYEKSPPDLL